MANQLEDEAETKQWTRIPKFITYEMRGKTLGLLKASGKVPSLEEQSYGSYGWKSDINTTLQEKFSHRVQQA